jgi:hypothetical protein
MFRISELPAIPAINPATDKLAIVDDSETETCRVTVDELLDVRFDETLANWTLASAFSITSATRDSDGVITTASILWPDGSAGTFTRTAKNATFLTIDAYTATHTDSGKTATQAAVTRDSSGNVTAQPALTITP